MLLSEIKSNPKNPRIIKDEAFQKLKQSIISFPQMLDLRPIVVNEQNVILGGNMRYKALVDLGILEAPVTVARGLTEAQQEEFTIKDNVSGGEWDWNALANEWNAEHLTTWGVEVPSSFVEEKEEIGLSEEKKCTDDCVCVCHED